jgi:hypothetical protein
MGHGIVCATGFNAYGTGFVEGATNFIVVIPGSEAEYTVKGNRETLTKPAVVAADIDPNRTYIGNTAGSIRPVRSQVRDVTDDGIDDLMLLYNVDGARMIELRTNSALALGEIWDGPVGLHFMGENDSPFLAADIFAYGTPMELHEAFEEPGQKGDDDPPFGFAPDAGVKSYDDGISSIFPNPFNPATTVRFTLARDANVKIAVYDVRGALVRVLVDRSMSRGEHTADWNGTDAQGRSVATGVYFARMITRDFQVTRKMVLVK